MDCKWLPDLIPCTDWTKFDEYEEKIYQIFKGDFIDTHPSFQGTPVKIRYQPYHNGREEAFFHITSQEYAHDGERLPDNKRCERIRWVRAFIENHECDDICPEPCDGVKVWYEMYRNYRRYHLLLEEENYMVLIEKRQSYTLLITAYYFDHPHSMRKQLKKYNEFWKARE